VLPVLHRECLGCHSGAAPASGYSMQTRDLLLRGGRHGAAIVPGKGAQSNLIRYMTGDLQPKMPPGGAIDRETIALLRRWIDEGAKVDALLPPSTVPSPASPLPAPGSRPAPVTALAYSPDGAILAAGGAADQVQALAWSGDGRFLAAAGGVPGEAGEVTLFDTATWSPVRTLAGHTEVVYAVAWRPHSSEIATGSLDKTARIWDAATGRCLHIIKDHAEAVLGLAYSPDGKLLATACADRSARLFDTTSWKRLAALTAHEDAVTRVAFNPSGTLLATAGADKTVRIWAVKIGSMDNPERTLSEADAVNDCAFSPDGKTLVWGASNGAVKVYNGDGTHQEHEMKEPQDWVYTVAVSHDNRTLAGGTQDGQVYLWDLHDGRLLHTLTLRPAATTGAPRHDSGR
jgi:WD40 repeat protein